MNSTASLIACPGCDLLLNKIDSATGTKLFCPRCNTILVHKKTNSINKGLLCEKGRFDLVSQQNQERLTKPMIRKNGNL
ncbi:MAG: hypothetical protein KAR01_12715, partial [Desulfocapsa sp.]|nr:hypothetical protein [Desulfocapsa sp.]